jgi:hypothetical protein
LKPTQTKRISTFKQIKTIIKTNPFYHIDLLMSILKINPKAIEEDIIEKKG